MFHKKGQAAMEFLMTYGWAILVVLVAIGALAYFGVLSPDNFLPERCTGPAGLDCLDKASISVTGNNVTFVLKNNIGFNIDSLSVSGGDLDCGTPQVYPASTVEIEDSSGNYQLATDATNSTPNNRKLKVAAKCTSTISSGRFKSNIELSYRNAQSGLSHTATVAITGSAS